MPLYAAHSTAETGEKLRLAQRVDTDVMSTDIQRRTLETGH